MEEYLPWSEEDYGNSISDIPLSEKKIDNEINTTEEEEVIREPPQRIKKSKIPRVKNSIERKPRSYYQDKAKGFNIPQCESEKPTEMPESIVTNSLECPP